MTGRNYRARFRKSYSLRENLRGSPRLWRMANSRKKEKWNFLSQRQRKYFLETGKGNLKEVHLLRLSKRFALEWREKQAFKEHYLVPKETHYRRFLRKARNVKTGLKDKDFSFPEITYNFLNLWESRLDTNLWKSHFFPTLPYARQAVLHGSVLLNGQKVRWPGVLLKAGDFVEVSLPDRGKLLKQREFESKRFNNFNEEKSRHEEEDLRRIPQHLEVHYGSLSFIFAEDPQADLSPYPYALSLKDLPLNLG